MTKIIFLYGAMNSGKSTMLLQSSFNYNERDMSTMLFIPKVINTGYIQSRIGIRHDACMFDNDYNFYENIESLGFNIKCIMIDEAQFLNKDQVLQLCKVADELKILVLCYGLRSDFKGEPFEGSKYLLTLADKLVELKTICQCGNKAIMNMRKKDKDSIFIPIIDGDQIDIGGNEKYIALCRKCYYGAIEQIYE
jgi:thymidine kinase